MAITNIDQAGNLSWPPQMIQPIKNWLRAVYELHMLTDMSPPAYLGFWLDCYANNESPLHACQHNYDFAPSAFSNREKIRSHLRYRPYMEMPPRAGIGELNPIKEWEW